MLGEDGKMGMGLFDSLREALKTAPADLPALCRRVSKIPALHEWACQGA